MKSSHIGRPQRPGAGRPANPASVAGVRSAAMICLKYGGRDTDVGHDMAACRADCVITTVRSEEHTSELQSLMRLSYAVLCLKKQTYLQLNHKQTNLHQS